MFVVLLYDHIQMFTGKSHKGKTPGPGCSKLTMSLVNISLKFQKLIFKIRIFFLMKKCETLLQCKSSSHCFNKNISAFGNKVVKHLTS